MNLRELFDTSVRLGIARDLRGEGAVREQLARAGGSTRSPGLAAPLLRPGALPQPLRRRADRLHARPPEQIEVRSIVLGIDVRLPELLLADRLRQEGRRWTR